MTENESRPTPSRRRLDPDTRRTEILTAAKTVFLRLGYAATTYRAIAEAADASVPLVHRYYPAKEELFDLAVRAPFEQLLRELEQESIALLEAEQGSAPNQLELFSQRMLVKVAELTPYVGMGLFAGEADSTRFYVDRVLPPIYSSAAALEKLLDQGDSTSYPSSLVVHALYGFYLGVDMNAMLRGKELDVPDVSRQLAKLLTHGLTGESVL